MRRGRIWKDQIHQQQGRMDDFLNQWNWSVSIQITYLFPAQKGDRCCRTHTFQKTMSCLYSQSQLPMVQSAVDSNIWSKNCWASGDGVPPQWAPGSSAHYLPGYSPLTHSAPLQLYSKHSPALQGVLQELSALFALKWLKWRTTNTQLCTPMHKMLLWVHLR